MTQEEKAKAYDEALKCAKMYYKENKDYNAEFLPIIFPEICESEDERIRKAIIGVIKNSNIIDINVSEKQMLAYLEKQKEQPKVDLEKEIEGYIRKLGFGYGGWVDGLSDEDLKNIARYFYELGLKAK